MNEPEPSFSDRESGRSLGKKLAQTRKARGWTLGYAASQLRLPESTLAHVEADEFSALPGEVYVKGYLRNYARLLRLAPEEIVQAYVEQQPTQAATRNLGSPTTQPPAAASKILLKSPSGLRPADKSRERSDDSQVSSSATLVGAALVVAAAYALTWWWPDSSFSLHEIRTRIADLLPNFAAPDRPIPEQSVGGSTPTPIELPSSDQTVNMEATLPRTASVTEAAAVAAPSAVEEPVSPSIATEQSPQQAGMDTLVLTFQGDSWATVIDSTGNRLMNQTGLKGSTKTLQGKAPFRLTIGRVSEVTIKMNSETFTLPNADKRATERFSVPFTGNQ